MGLVFTELVFEEWTEKMSEVQHCAIMPPITYFDRDSVDVYRLQYRKGEWCRLMPMVVADEYLQYRNNAFATVFDGFGGGLTNNKGNKNMCEQEWRPMSNPAALPYRIQMENPYRSWRETNFGGGTSNGFSDFFGPPPICNNRHQAELSPLVRGVGLPVVEPIIVVQQEAKPADFVDFGSLIVDGW